METLDSTGLTIFKKNYRRDIRAALRILRMISDRCLDVKKNVSVYFIDWQKSFDRVN